MPKSRIHKSTLARIRAIALDVDGVLTDGSVWWGPNGEEFKSFSFTDIMGISLARRTGIEFALISGEQSPLVDRYAQKMRIQHVVKGCRDKASALRHFSESANIPLAEIAYMGDDVNDAPAMLLCGLSAAPANAAQDVLSLADYVSKHTSGSGAVRELIETLFKARGLTALSVYSKI